VRSIFLKMRLFVSLFLNLRLRKTAVQNKLALLEHVYPAFHMPVKKRKTFSNNYLGKIKPVYKHPLLEPHDST